MLREAAARSMADLHTCVLSRAMPFRSRGARGGPDVLVVGQKGVINSLRGMGLPGWIDPTKEKIFPSGGITCLSSLTC